MFEWWAAAPAAGAVAVPARACGAARARAGASMSGPYLLLYTYLDTRFADTVVLTFAQIEDVLGFALPAQARLQPEWWTDATDQRGGAASLGFVDARPTDRRPEPDRPDRLVRARVLSRPTHAVALREAAPGARWPAPARN